jgi:hypothetical protein
VQQITEYLFLWGKIPLSCPKSSRKIVYKGKSILLAHKYMTIHFTRLGPPEKKIFSLKCPMPVETSFHYFIYIFSLWKYYIVLCLHQNKERGNVFVLEVSSWPLSTNLIFVYTKSFTETYLSFRFGLTPPVFIEVPVPSLWAKVIFHLPAILVEHLSEFHFIKFWYFQQWN